MAHPKVTVSEVEGIFDTDVGSLALQRWIDIAHRKIDRLLSDAGYSDDELRDIEVLYAAGLAEQQDPRISSARGTSSQVDYMQQSYLEMAFQLEETGRLRQAHRSGQELVWKTGGFAD